MAPLLAADAEAVIATSQNLTEADVVPLFDEALTAWAAAGISDSQLAQLEGLQVQIADLFGALSGTQVGNTITLDINAAGHGWFVSPGSRDKSLEPADSDAHSDSGLSTSDSRLRIDLLTVLYHELGHALGLEDDYSDPSSDHITNGWLPIGTRRMPGNTAIDALMADLALDK